MFKRLLSIITVLVIVLTFYYFLTRLKTEIGMMLFLLAYGALPSLILFIEYFIKTIKINTVEFNENTMKVLYKNGVVKSYDYTDLKVIKLYKAAGMDKGNFSFNMNEKYYFANVIAKNGKHIILTSLLGPDLSDGLNLIKDVPVDRTKTGYAFIFFNRN